MELGISTGYSYDKSIFETLPLISQAGFSFVELWTNPLMNGEYVHFDWHGKSDVNNLAALLKDLGLKINSLHAPFSAAIDISSLDETARARAVEDTVRSMEALKTCEGRILVMHPAACETYHHERGKRFAQSRKSIEEVARFAGEMALEVAVENQLPHLLGGDVPTLLALIEGIDGAGICFDTSHAHLYHKQSIDNIYKQLGGRVTTLHISDNGGKHDDHSVPGEGTINWPPFLHALAAGGYKGVFLLETVPHKRHGQEDPLKTLKSIHERITALITPPHPLFVKEGEPRGEL